MDEEHGERKGRERNEKERERRLWVGPKNEYLDRLRLGGCELVTGLNAGQSMGQNTSSGTEETQRAGPSGALWPRLPERTGKPEQKTCFQLSK